MNMASRCVWGLSGLMVSAIVAGLVAAQAMDVVVKDAWVRVPLPSKNDTALYLVLENRTAQSRSVVAVSSEEAVAAEMHTMKMDGRMMSMAPVERIEIAPNGRATLAPGGLHIMLFGLKERLAAGDMVHVSLTLDNGQKISVSATAR